MVLIQETILTGSSDGLIRLCSIFPNKLLGVVGSHDDFPVEAMKVGYNIEIGTRRKRMDGFPWLTILASVGLDAAFS